MMTFLLTRPLRDVTTAAFASTSSNAISTHTPLAGRDGGTSDYNGLKNISTHTPLAGRDRESAHASAAANDFYSHAPCGT